MSDVPHPAVVFRFGVFEVDVTSGELRKYGLRVRLQEQPFQVLVLLLEHAGEVVSRDQLFRRLWASDTFVDFEQGLGTAIKKLRQALNDDAEAPRYVETLPKRGYRFIAPVERVAASDAAPDFGAEIIPELSPEPLPPELPTIEYWRAPPTRWRPVLLGAAFLTVAVLAGIGFEMWRNPHRKQAVTAENQPAGVESYTSRPLTTLPGGEYEPALSPDGKMIAFVWDEQRNQRFHVYTQAVDVGSPARLTNGPGEGSPVWSPDGRYIAFITCTDNIRESGIYIIPISGGTPRKIATIAPRVRIFDRQIDWSPDGNSLAVADRNSPDEPYAIYLLALNSGAKRRLVAPLPATPGDTGPVFSPDGRQIAFRRTASIGNNDIYIVNASSGTPRRLTFDQRFTSAHGWTPDGRDIVFASKRSGSLSLWRIHLAGGSPQPIPGNTEGAYNLAIPRAGDRLVYSKYLSDSNIWETDLQTGRSKRLLGSTRNETSPQYSPDGTRIAFRSDRTGADEIWVGDASGENAVRLTSFNGPLTGTPRWSPDSRYVAFDSRPNGNPDIYVVGETGGPPRRVTAAASEDVLPSWSGDGRWIYFASNRSGRWQVWEIASQAVEESSAPVQLTRNGGFAAFESPDAKTVFYAKGRDLPGIWALRASGDEQLVTDRLQPGYWGNWGVAPAGLFFVSPVPPDTAEIDLYSFASRRTRRVALLDKPPPFSDSGFAVRSDGRKILHAQADQSSSEIILVENFH